MGVCYFISKCIDKWLGFYRKKCFESYIGQKCPGLKILGKIHCRNKNIRVGKNVIIYPNVMFMGEGEIVIGDNTFIQVNTVLYSHKDYKIFIGNDVMIAWNSFITTSDHRMTIGRSMIDQGVVSSDVTIEDDVWIGGDASILRGSYIKRGCVIGAKSLVNTVTEENGIYVGIPAKKIKTRE